MIKKVKNIAGIVGALCTIIIFFSDRKEEKSCHNENCCCKENYDKKTI